MSTDEIDVRCMREALRLAREASERGEVPIGAVVACEGRVLARCHNLTETLIDATAHAEMQAITSASAAVGGKYLPKCTLYVTIEPCAMCAAALGWAQIGRVVYGAPDEKRGYRLYAPHVLHPRTQVDHGLMEDECAQLMRQFFSSRRKSKI